MDFSRSIDYLLSLGNEVSAMKLGLENIRTLLTALGDPHEKYFKVQIAGTNGKGSVCAFLDSICNEAGIRTGTYTSPHLISITERITINGVDISEDEFTRTANVVRDTAETLLSEKRLDYRPTFFEQMTAIALAVFAEAKVEVAILETGLGGRLDATTAANAEIAAITPIDLDHQEYLGNTIEEIAAEKAAIIRQNSQGVVLGRQNQIAMETLIARCRSLAITPSIAAPLDGIGLLGLPGRHQKENADIAVSVALLLRDRFTINDEHIRSGLARAKHPGRLEYVTHRYLLDGAHNPLGAMALRNFLNECEKQRNIVMIFGAMEGKNVAEMLAELTPLVDHIVFTQPENSRSKSPDDLMHFVPDDVMKTKTILLSKSVEVALADAEALASADGLILITGSLYLVGEAKKLLQEKAKAEI
jgi:dihydrofolate synthase / folylpolyglutamate synthase